MAVAYQKKTLRQMSPTTRKVARLTGEALSVGRRFKNLVPEIQRLELDSRALTNAKQVDQEALTRKLRSIELLSGMSYTEIHNVDAINHTLTTIHDHTLRALELLQA